MFYLFYIYQLVKLILIPVLLGAAGTYYIVNSSSETAKYLRKFFGLQLDIQAIRYILIIERKLLL